MPKQKLTKRADGRYSSQIYLGIVDGKRKYKTVYGRSPTELKDKVSEMRVMLSKGIDLSSTEDTFNAWKDNFLLSKKDDVSEPQ